MQDSFKSQISSAKSVLVLLPSNPGFDEVAASLSLFLSLRTEEGREVLVSSPTPMVVEFNRLVGVNKIVQGTELGNKNLVIKFVDYQATNIEKVSYDIENGEFKLTVVPKPGMTAPTKDQINLSYSGISADTVILIGGDSFSSFPALASKDLASVKVIHIGIKSLETSGRPVISFATASSSVSEVVANLIKQSGLNIDGDVATNLIAGIEKGSNNFTDLRAQAETFILVGELMKMGGRRTLTEQIRPESFPQGSIPGQDVEQKETPQAWLEPKIYKGTSVS